MTTNHSDARLTLTKGEAARELKVSERHVSNLIRRGLLPVVYFGKSVRIPRVQLEAMLAGETRRPPPAATAESTQRRYPNPDLTWGMTIRPADDGS